MNTNHSNHYNMDKIKFNRKKIIELLNEKGANQPCHRCGNDSFAVIDGFTRFHLSEDMRTNNIGGQGVPAIIVACNNCGAITPHAALALIKPDQNKKGGNYGR